MMAKMDGGATGIRTPDLLHAMQALCQLSYSPAVEGQYSSGPGSIRRGTHSVSLTNCPVPLSGSCQAKSLDLGR
jgi:hypothetical protein